MNTLQIEPELNRSPPRRVRRRGNQGLGLLLCQLFFVPILLSSLIMPLWAGHLILVLTEGTTVPSTIVDKYRKWNTDDHRWNYYLKYSATIAGKRVTQREFMDEASYQKTAVGAQVPLLISPLFPGNDSMLVVPGRNLTVNAWFFSITSIFLLGIDALLIWAIFWIPHLRKRLVVMGTPVTGLLTNKTQYHGRKAHAYYLHYEYEPQSFEIRQTPQNLKGQLAVSPKVWLKPEIGETYTVFYDPKKPHRSLLYQFSNYRVD